MIKEGTFLSAKAVSFSNAVCIFPDEFVHLKTEQDEMEVTQTESRNTAFTEQRKSMRCGRNNDKAKEVIWCAKHEKSLVQFADKEDLD